MTDIKGLKTLVKSLLEALIVLLVLVLGVLNLYWQDFIIAGILLVIGFIGVLIVVYNVA